MRSLFRICRAYVRGLAGRDPRRLYAERITESMRLAIEETERHRRLQEEYNAAHGITPQSIDKAIRQGIEHQVKAHDVVRSVLAASESGARYETRELLAALEQQMLEAAEQLEFEKAAALRDRILALRQEARQSGQPVGATRGGRRRRSRRSRYLSTRATSRNLGVSSPVTNIQPILAKRVTQTTHCVIGGTGFAVPDPLVLRDKTDS